MSDTTLFFKQLGSLLIYQFLIFHNFFVDFEENVFHFVENVSRRSAKINERTELIRNNFLDFCVDLRRFPRKLLIGL